MVKLKLFGLSFFCLFSVSGCASLSHKSINEQSGEPARLVVNIEGIESVEGKILVYIHDNEHSYHNDHNREGFTPYSMQAVEPKLISRQIVFENLPAGRYAVSAYHDENSNGKLDRMIFPFMGMPTENYGSSNDVFSYFSKGSFKDAQIEVMSPESIITIRLVGHLSRTFGG